MPAHLPDRLERLTTLVPICAREAMTRTTRWMADEAKRTHPFRNRTHNLEDSIAGGVTEATTQHVVGALSAGYPTHGQSHVYAGFVELGTSHARPYPYLWPTTLAAHQQRIFEDFFRT